MKDRVIGKYAPLTDLEIEQFLCGELTGDAAERIERQAEKDPALATHLAERRAQQQAFFQAHPRLEVELPPERRRWVGWSLGLAGAAAAAVLVVVALFAWPMEPGTGSDGPTIRARGALKVGLTVRRAERTFAFREGVLLRPGDRVRLSLEATEAGFLTLIGRDQHGRWTIYYDGLPTTAGTWTVPDSLVLDDDPNPEHWYALLTSERIEAKKLLDRLRAGQPLEAAASMLTLTKETGL